MRLTLFSTVAALVLFSLTPCGAWAAFEMVSPQTASKVATAEAMPAPAIDPMQPIDNAGVSSEAMPEPAPALKPSLKPMAQSSLEGEPMPLGSSMGSSMATDDAPFSAVKAGPAPLTPIAHDSDALVVESRPPAPILPVIKTEAMPVPDDFATPFSAPSRDDAIAQGFGRDVPLVLALQQIVPPNYRYSFDPGVNPGMRVSWSGGQPWKNVIMDLAQSHNMNVDIVSNVVAFRPQGAPAPALSAPPMESADAALPPLDDEDTTSAMPTPIPSPIPSPMQDAPLPLAPPVKSVAPEAPTPIRPMGPMGDSAPKNLLPVITPPVMPPVTPPVAHTTTTTKTRSDMHRTLNAARQEVAFDPLLNANMPARDPVPNKQILTADDDSAAFIPPTPVPQDIAMQPLMPEAPMPLTPAPKPIVTEHKMAPPPPPVPSPMAEASPMPIVPNMDVAVADTTAGDPVAMTGMAEMKPADLTTPLQWDARKGQTLRQALTEWSTRAGVSLVWSSEYDYPLQTDVRVDAGFSDAARTLLAGFSKAQPRPLGRLFNNKQAGSQPVLIIETQRLTD